MRQKRQSLSLFKFLVVVQSGYYFITGFWPVLHIESFEKITGPKVDRWLVKTVGLLVAAIGAGIAMGGLRNRAPDELKIIAASSGVGLAAIDIYYVAKNRISKVYLLDAISEIGMAVGWLLLAEAERNKKSSQPKNLG